MEHEPYRRYSYNGPILEFGKMITDRWFGETLAPSEKKARSNLAHQYKKQNNRNKNTKVTLPGKINVGEYVYEEI